MLALCIQQLASAVVDGFECEVCHREPVERSCSVRLD
jgi:hypothetical protein